MQSDFPDWRIIVSGFIVFSMLLKKRAARFGNAMVGSQSFSI
jgi:hypothetical protein